MKLRLLIISIFLQASLYSQQLKLEEPVRFLALGDSYTAGIGIDPDQNWPSQLFKRLAESGYITDRIRILAQAGWTTDDLTRAVREEELHDDFNMVSLLIGVNNQYQGITADMYEKEFEELLVIAINLARGRKEGVFVISIPDYAYTPFGGGLSYISEGIDMYNKSNSKITAKYGIPYFDITFISRQGLERPELVAGDKLHPSALMYKMWVDMIMDHINAYNTTHGIEDKTTLLNGMIIYPNPASDKISIKTTSPDIFELSTLSIYTLSGKLVFSKKDLTFQLSDIISVSLPELSEGFYLLELVTVSGNFVSKMVIKNRH